MSNCMKCKKSMTDNEFKTASVECQDRDRSYLAESWLIICSDCTGITVCQDSGVKFKDGKLVDFL